MTAHTRIFVLVWIALMVLLGLTLTASFLPLGAFKPVANIGIGFAKAVLIFWFFMHLREVSGLVRLAAVAGVLSIVLMIALISSDYLTRL